MYNLLLVWTVVGVFMRDLQIAGKSWTKGTAAGEKSAVQQHRESGVDGKNPEVIVASSRLSLGSVVMGRKFPTRCSAAKL